MIEGNSIYFVYLAAVFPNNQVSIASVSLLKRPSSSESLGHKTYDGIRLWHQIRIGDLSFLESSAQ